MKNKYSVIIPTYNASQTIERCLDSILKQSDNNIEIVIIDDNSIDNTSEIISNYNTNIKLIKKNKNEGPSVARNIGIKECSGNYIVFIDADDYIEDDYFSTIDSVLDNRNIDLLKINADYHGKRIDKNLFNNDSTNIIKGEELLLKLLNENKIFSTPWMYIIKKDIFMNNNLFFSENRIHEDLGLMPCLILKADKALAIDYVGYNYVYQENSLSTSRSYEQIVRRANDIIYQYDFLIDYFNKNTDNEVLKSTLKGYLKNSLNSKKKRLVNPELEAYEKQLQKRKVL